ncbi:NAD-dependent epimerase/dehydratase family protein [Amorphus sp. 3PC139-8]|uniref:NAD-dependent epimerase/dehydratase family protein n=1 Tax=Amorphus sp. 3PC139-8 TaxID=2735676 RepID=UPI00345D4FD9
MTGSEGFIGRSIVDALLARQETVIALDRAHAECPAATETLIRVSGDIRDTSFVVETVRQHKVRAILNLAALIIPACKADPVLGAEVDIIGHINMFEAARAGNIKRVVYTSSVASKPRAPFNSPVNLYGVYKRTCEDIAKVYFLDYAIPSVGVRPNIVYGPGREVGETAFVSKAVAAAVAGEPFEMPFTGDVCLQHVDEIVDVLLRCLYASPDAPVVSDITTDISKIDDVASVIEDLIPGAKIALSDKVRPAPADLDNEPLRELLGVWPSISLREGIERTKRSLSQR